MNKLTTNWLTENHIDFEYKKYMLLAYLQEVEQHYKNTQIYPWLTEVIDHYRNLLIVKNNAENLKKGFQKEVKGIDLKTLKIIYENDSEPENEVIQEIKNIIEYSLPLFHHYIIDGKKIYDYVEERLKIKSIGITPLRNTEGYLFLNIDKQKDIHVYQYYVSFFEDANEHLKSLSTEHIETYTSNITWTYEKVKSDLILKRKELPNPAVYAIECDVKVPFTETFLPIAKRYFVTQIAA